MKTRTALLLATMLAAPLAAHAQPIDGIYIGAGAGVNLLQNDIVNGYSLRQTQGPGAGSTLTPGANRPHGVHLNSEVGFAGVLSVGYGFGNGLRVEAEGNFRQNDVRHFNGTPFPTSTDGTTRTYGIMGNILYDFDLSPYGINWMMPYAGGGVGYAFTDFDDIRSRGTNFPFLVSAKGTEGNFAYQGIAGVAFPIASVPGLAVTAEYRFFGVAGNERFRTGAVIGTTPYDGKVSIGDQFNHSAMLGVRYAFNTAPPPPPPAAAVAPAAQPARSYLVFFDWDRADLTDRARQIISEAAQNSTRVQYTRIEVNGYTDTSGTAAYNQRLSVRRAQNVAAELVKDGVPRQAISIQGFGETHLLVPTAKGVREPQNRRVEIIIR